MQKTSMKNIASITLVVFMIAQLNGQVIRGKVSDSLGMGLKATLTILSPKALVVSTDSVGQFEIKIEIPAEVKVEAEGYKTQTVILSDYKKYYSLYMQAGSMQSSTVNITHNRLKEKLRESPVTVESMTAQSIKETPASDFYEGLGHLRGVDVTAASMGFRIINTRGFNSTSPVRSLQLIDGVDNQAPGLNFSLGNFLGASELDVANTEIIVGASSAYYGPNAFNGVINMTTKSPWQYKGLSAQLKIGEREMGQLMVRFADVIKNKAGKEKFAYKLSLSYFRAYDWVANNDAPTEDSKVGKNNPGGYDAVNRYGDEVFGAARNDQVSNSSRVTEPGLGAHYRQGYWEKALVDYNTRNLKTSAMMAYKINDKNELQYQFNFGTGTTVYQGDNRYSLNGILFFQNRLEWAGKKGHLRFYMTHENAGNTYDAVLTAFILQDYTKKGSDWFGDYQNYWLSNIRNKVRALPGYPTGNPISNPNWYNQQNAVFQKYADSLFAWHNLARSIANRQNDFKGLPYNYPTYNRLEPGTPEFNQEFNRITSNYAYSTTDGFTGSRFFDQSAMYHLTGEKKFSKNEFNFITGFSARLYRPYSKGTIFIDSGNRRISNAEAGIYAGADKRFWKKRLKINLTFRLDKNINFDYLFSPAISFVYSKTKRHTYRMSFNSAIRNPTLQDQYLSYNVGRAILKGNIDGFENVYELQNFIDYLNTRNRDTLNPISVPAIKPEQVRTLDFGYKGFLFDNKLLIDAGYYLSFYTNFIGYRLLIDANIDTFTNLIKSSTAYRVASNSRDVVSTQGVSAAATFFFYKKMALTANWSYNALDRRGSKDPLIPAFNTPRNKFNIGIGGNELNLRLSTKNRDFHFKDFGFNINYKWVEQFVFEGSPQFTGLVPSYYSIDLQISKNIKKWNSILKIGASNITNNAVFQVFGGPRIGRMAYISFTYEP